jgi:hypothetical protein
MLTTARKTTYLTGALGIVGVIVAALGWADFDSTTGMIDPKPFNIYALAALLPAAASPFLAFVAVVKGWGKK